MQSDRKKGSQEKPNTTQKDVLDHLSKPKNRIGGRTDAGNNDQHHFVQAPRDLLVNVIARNSGLSLKDIAHTAQTCQRLHTLFQPEVNMALAAEVCHMAAWGMQDEAEKLLSSLNTNALHAALTTTVTIEDYAGRKHTGTAFELALKMGDVTHDPEQSCMAEMLATHMRKLENGQTIIDKQFTNVFGNDFDAHLAKQKENVYSLDAVVTAINEATEEQLQAQLTHQNNDSTLNQTIAVFRQQFAERSLQEETYNPYHILNALDVYNNKFDKWNWNQRDLFWRQIIGGMQRFWPRCWLQAAKTGLWNLTEKEPRSDLDRGVDVKNYATYKMISLDKLDDDLNSRLGFDFAIYSEFCMPPGDCECVGAFALMCIRRPASYFTKLISSKNQSIQSLCSRTENRRTLSVM